MATIKIEILKDIYGICKSSMFSVSSINCCIAYIHKHGEKVNRKVLILDFDGDYDFNVAYEYEGHGDLYYRYKYCQKIYWYEDPELLTYMDVYELPHSAEHLDKLEEQMTRFCGLADDVIKEILEEVRIRYLQIV